MDTKEIQRLLDYIAKSPLAEVSIETEGLKVSVKKHAARWKAEAEKKKKDAEAAAKKAKKEDPKKAKKEEKKKEKNGNISLVLNEQEEK